MGDNAEKKRNIRAQATVFIIIALVIFATVLAFVILRGFFTTVDVPARMEPIYDSFLFCLEQNTETGIGVLESQAGYIELPKFESGSEFMPFSSQLNFLGNPIPYWYYVSGNNIPKEQVPSKNDMESQLENFIESRADDCNFDTYTEQGFEISVSEVSADVVVRDNNVEVSLNADLSISDSEGSVVIRSHDVVANSRLGALYDSAVEIYNTEQNELFLEEYGIDTLRLYAPVDGTEFTCSPLTWEANEVFDNLQDAIEVNTLALGTNREKDYFNVEALSNRQQEVTFLNSRYWPTTIQVLPSQENVLTASPVGNQPGLGILGFCYVSYHFVYDLKYPVLVQVKDSDTGEVFQFPMAVIIQGNNEREPLVGEAGEGVSSELCEFKNTPIQISTKDSSNGAPVDAQISYECFQTKCNIGITENGVLEENFPQCVNGYVLARAPGFSDARYLLSTLSQGNLELVLDKVYDIDVNLKVDGVAYNGDALINFVSGEKTKTISYPSADKVGLSEGAYDLEVYVYKSSSVNIGATVAEQCIDILRGGVLGVFGLKEEKCFDIEVPEQIISNALAGGGKQSVYISKSDLTKGRIELNVESFPTPDTVEQIQTNYILFESKDVEVSF